VSEKAIDVHTREASRIDIPEIVMVVTGSISDGEDEGFGGPGTDSPFRSAAKLSTVWQDPNRVGTEEILVAEIDGHVVGVVAVEDREGELELVDIDVIKRYQGRGIGTRLLQFVEERARSRHKVAVTLGTSRNAEGTPWKALPWWQSMGYDITHEEKNAWTRSIGPGAREIRMRKNL
jgi:ribosomal protein S18 acetylase RimI-like enzyme